MLSEFIEFNKKNKLFTTDDKILLALSGGRDSMFMLEMFINSNIIPKKNIVIAHCNFSLRGKESDNDEIFVINTAKQHKISFYVKKFNTKKFAEENKLSIQMAARKLRYNWFAELSKQLSLTKTAIAHNLDDKIETFFINLVRGTGLQGLKGINAKNGEIIRPIMFASRKRISNYLTKKNISWRDDSSNNSVKYLRNKIRHNILPEFENITPSFLNKMNENIDIFSKTYTVFTELIQAEIKNLSYKVNSQLHIDTIKLLQKNNPEIYIYEIVKNYGFSTAQLPDILQLINAGTGKYIKTGNYTILKDRKKLIIFANTEKKKINIKINKLEDLNTLPLNIKYEITNKIPESFPNNNNTVYLDFEKIKFPLTLRTRQNGDKFKPFGMNNFRLLSDFLKDLKLSGIDKDNVLLLTDAKNNILWVIPHRSDNRYRINSETKNILILKLL
jgi:tRNA(Ile)-lysidine synthase